MCVCARAHACVPAHTQAAELDHRALPSTLGQGRLPASSALCNSGTNATLLSLRRTRCTCVVCCIPCAGTPSPFSVSRLCEALPGTAPVLSLLVSRVFRNRKPPPSAPPPWVFFAVILCYTGTANIFFPGDTHFNFDQRSLRDSPAGHQLQAA